MTYLRIASTATPEATVIAPIGELDVGSVKRFDDAISKADGQNVIVDLREVDFLDSVGLSAILRAADATASRGALQVIPGPRCVDRLFDLTKTRSRIHFVEHTAVDAPIAELWLG
jgi:anti-anti-sigma factor